MKKKISVISLILQFVVTIPLLLACIFGPAGTFEWIEGWIYFVLQMAFPIFFTFYFWKKNPEILEKRMEKKLPEQGWDRILMFFLSFLMIIGIILPGFDAVRFQWSQLPFFMKVLGFIFLNISFYLLLIVMSENSFLKKTIEIQEDHQVVKDGLYAYVRHPMYSAVILMMFSISALLGSFYTFFIDLLIAIILIIRINFEEKFLVKNLVGYKPYMKEVKYKIIPKIY